MKTDFKPPVPMKIAGPLKQDSHVIFSISIGSSQTGKDFSDMVDAICEDPAITELTLFKADTLQRHRLQTNPKYWDKDKAALSATAAADSLEEAKGMSKEWDEKNEQAIAKLKKHFGEKFHRKSWDDYRLSQGFDEMYKLIDSHHKNKNNDFQQNVEGLRLNFYNKFMQEYKQSKPTKAQRDNAKELLTTYVLEECAVLALMSLDEEAAYRYELYNGERSRAMTWAHRECGDSDRVRPITIARTEVKGEMSKKKSTGESSTRKQRSLPFFDEKTKLAMINVPSSTAETPNLGLAGKNSRHESLPYRLEFTATRRVENDLMSERKNIQTTTADKLIAYFQTFIQESIQEGIKKSHEKLAVEVISPQGMKTITADSPQSLRERFDQEIVPMICIEDTIDEDMERKGETSPCIVQKT